MDKTCTLSFSVSPTKASWTRRWSFRGELSSTYIGVVVVIPLLKKTMVVLPVKAFASNHPRVREKQFLFVVGVFSSTRETDEDGSGDFIDDDDEATVALLSSSFSRS